MSAYEIATNLLGVDSLPELQGDEVSQESSDTWFWYAKRARLTVDDAQMLYSEHVYVCQKVSHKVVEGLLSMVTLNGGAAADIYGTKAKKVAFRERQAAIEAWRQAGNTVPLPSEAGSNLESATQLPLFH